MSAKKQYNVKQNINPNFSLEQFYSKYYEILVLYAFKFIKDIEIAKDLTQDAFLSLLKRKDKEEVQNVKSFLFQSVRNNCLNFINHNTIKNVYEKAELQRIKSEIEFYNSNTSFVEKDLFEKITGILDQLPEKYSEILKLSRFDGFSNKEISEKLGIPLRTVETRIYRGLEMLRKKLDKNNFLFFSILF